MPDDHPSPPTRERRSAHATLSASLNGHHPALLPGIGVDKTPRRYGLNIPVFITAFVGVLTVVLWGMLAPESLEAASGEALGFVTHEMGWFFVVLTALVFGFMLWLGLGRHRHIKLGADDEKPEFSTVSWIAMLFSAGIGIGLIFYGPQEPFTYFSDLPPIYADLAGDEQAAVQAAINQTLFHWGPPAFAYYALVGGAVAYAAYRKGRVPLMSALLEPLFGKRTEGPLGAAVDTLAILVTLFSTAISLGIGALQIGTGMQIVTGIGDLGNAAIVGIISLLCIIFVLSAVSGIKRGIRALSNVNMILAGGLGIFVLLAGPTLVILNLIPGVGMSFLGDLPSLMSQNAAMGDTAAGNSAADFMSWWTIYYWAWWVSWTPFVGLFIAKISRGRTLREFVAAVIIAPSIVCMVWFTIIGGASLHFEQESGIMSDSASGESMFFDLLDQLPLSMVTSVIVMISIIIFFVTSGDSASVVMSSIAERGSPTPKLWNTAIWGVGMAAVAAVLLTATGEAALGQLQSLMMISALPFALILVLVMVAWAKELNRDPMTIRRRFEREALRQGVAAGISRHGDDFTLAVKEAPAGEGAGAWLDTKDPVLTEWWDTATGPVETVDPGPDPRRQADDDESTNGHSTS